MTQGIFDSLRVDDSSQQKSVQWYQAQVRKLGTINTRKLFLEGTLTNQIFPGEMYLFRYDPKTKDALPYYDMFPLALPFRRIPGGFLGVNFHYLNYAFRLKMLRMLSQYATNSKFDETTRVRVTWRLLESTSRLAPIKFCVKHYLTDQIQSRFIKIPFPDWVVASQLPVERFMKAEKTNVWRETRKKFL